MKSISGSIFLAALATSAMVGADLVSAQSAQALSFDYDLNTVTLDATSVGQSFTIYSYGGSVGDVNLPGDTFTNDLRAAALFTLNSFDGTNAGFTVDLSNDSGGDITSSRLSVFGFDVLPSNGSFNEPGTTSTGFFTFVGAGQVNQPAFLGFSDVDACFRNSPPGANNVCTAGAGGVAQGTSETFSPTLAFAGGPVTSFTLQNFYFRYQSIEGKVNGITLDDASGVGSPGVVPTPALLPGLLGLGVAALRKKQGDMAEEA